MRAIWIDNGQDANPAALRKHAITDPYFDVRDPQCAQRLTKTRDQGFAPGVYLCSQGDGWPSASKLSGKEWAKWAYDNVQRVAYSAAVKACLNCETHDPDWIVEMLRQWRRHSPRRVTFWALEGMQGQLFTEAHVAAINKTGVGVAPEFFRGNMEPHGPGVVLELLAKGFNPRQLFGFFDAARLPFGWARAFAFTQGRLPA